MELGVEVHAAFEAAGTGSVDSFELIRDSPGRPVWRVAVSGGNSLVVKHVTSDDDALWDLVQRDGSLDATGP